MSAIQTSAEPNDWFALTSMQMSMLYESMQTGRAGTNIEQAVVHFDQQRLDEGTVRRAWQEIAARHDALRLVCDWHDRAHPQQRVTDNISVPISVLDWSTQSAAEQKKNLEQFLEADRAQGINLETATPWRVTLIRLNDIASIMILTIHHVVVDGRSIAQILCEFLAYLKSGTLQAIPAPSSDFRAYCLALEQDLLNQEAAQIYFKDYLADFDDIGTLNLPPIGEVEETGTRQKLDVFELEPHLKQQLQLCARKSGGTLANLVQAAWGIVLARWQGSEEVAFGVIRSGRHGVAISATSVGCFISSFPMRMSLDKDLTLGILLAKLRRDTLALHPLEHTSANVVRENADLNGQQSLFDSLVMFENADLEGLVLGSSRPHPSPRIELHEEGGMPLTLAVYGQENMRFVLEHDPSQVPSVVAARMFDHLLVLLQNMALADRETRIGALEMLGQSERDALLKLAQPDRVLTHDNTCLVQQFEGAVQASPSSIAIETVGTDTSLTYQDLDARAKGLALALQAKGVTTGDVVAIGLPRSPEFIVAMLAVLRTGAAFVPVDPTYPAKTRDHMLADSGASVLIANADAQHSVDLPVLSPDQGLSTNPMPLPTGTPEQRAYIIYTSGSTGIPKGVAASRGNFLSHIAAISSEFELTSQDRVLQFASLSFDVALEEVFPTLMAGATLVLRSEDMAQSLGTFVERCHDLRLSVLNLPTAFWSLLADFLPSSEKPMPECLRLMVVGGEQVKPNSLIAWQKAVPNVRWLNGYGPTETTITCTLHEISEAQTEADIPIGRPVAHATTYVMAADGSMAPMGAVGELVIGGQCVTLGYVGRPEETDKAFVNGAVVGENRLYRSGDRAQWRPDGALNFFGRRDRQAKVRGYRIDLRQIEHAIESIDTSFEVLAGVLNEGTAAAQLVAWIEGDNRDKKELEAEVADRLPAHMRPALAFVPEFPKTAGGKIDKSALPDPEPSAVEAPENSTPVSQLEADICMAMAKSLGRKTVAPSQDFHDLGGHSLLAVELIGRLETLSGKRLGIMDFRENATPRALARLLQSETDRPKRIITIQPQGTRPPLFAVHILGPNEEYFRPLAAHLGLDQPIMGISVGSLDKDTPTGIENTAKIYCEELNKFYPTGPISLMAVSLGSYMALELARQLRQSGRDIGLVAFFDAAGPGGRDEYQGWRRLCAHFKRAQYIGLKFPVQIVNNRIHNLKNFFASKKIQKATSEGDAKAPMTVYEFIASNEIAVNEYSPGSLDVPLTIFRAENHFFDTEIARQTGLGWEPVATAGFEVVDVPGGHLSLLQEPHIDTLAKRMAESLDKHVGRD